MSKKSPNLTMDAWIREAEEASQWVEDLESRANHNHLNLAQTSESVVDSARSKLLEVGVKLDRLESLLRNPPTRPVLTGEDMDFRWKMLSDIQLRTRSLARNLYALPCPSRPRNLLASSNKESNVSTDCYDQVVDLMKTPYSQDHSELLRPLLSDDESNNQIQPFSSMSMTSLWKACSAVVLFFGLAALLFVVVLLCTTI